MNIITAVKPECIVVHAPLAGKTEALRVVARAAKDSTLLKDVTEDEVYAGLQAREELGSTGFGKGIAIPHCRLGAAKDFVVGMVTSPAGVDFASLDGEKTRLLVFIIGPEDESDDHVRLLSAVSRTLQVPGAIEEIVAESTPEAVRESFLRHTRSDLQTSKKQGLAHIQVFVQNAELFHDILGQLVGTETGSLLVIEAENVAAYLHRAPLFAGLLRDVAGGFCKVIVMTVDRRLTNETVRRIESVTGPLDERGDILVTVQNLTYASGHLGVGAERSGR
jgi:PTS system nitrogen regulatory IIA component